MRYNILGPTKVVKIIPYHNKSVQKLGFDTYNDIKLGVNIHDLVQLIDHRQSRYPSVSKLRQRIYQSGVFAHLQHEKKSQ